MSESSSPTDKQGEELSVLRRIAHVLNTAQVRWEGDTVMDYIAALVTAGIARSDVQSALPKQWGTGWLIGNNYKVRGKVLDAVGSEEKEPWYIAEDGTRWSGFDVSYRPDTLPLSSTLATGDRGCPCLYTTPCKDNCTCVNWTSSAGCARCCTYGSLEQRTKSAERLASLPLSATMFTSDTARLDWLFSELNDEKIKAKLEQVSDAHSHGGLLDIHMGDFRASIDHVMQLPACIECDLSGKASCPEHGSLSPTDIQGQQR